jgi:predicted alpha/beta superfamily hydrolase
MMPRLRAVVTKFVAVSAALSALSASSAVKLHSQNVRRLPIESKILSETRFVRIALPANYSIAKQKYPVIYLLDGQVQAFFDVTVAASRYDLIGDIRDFAIPPHIVVSVEHPDRGVDLGRNADTFMKYLTDELVPWVEKNYRASAQRVLIGHSLGGRFALMASCRAPGKFPSIVAVSPGGGDSAAYRNTIGCLKSDWAASRGVLRQVYINSGEREARIDEGAKRLRDFLRDSAPPNVKWKYDEGPGLAHTETPYFGIPAGIKFIHDRLTWEMPPALADSVMKGIADPSELLLQWYMKLNARVGYSVPTSAKWLDAAVIGQLARGDHNQAAATARWLVDQYPEDLTGYGRLADILLRRGDRSGARRVMEDALRIADKIEFFDETERALKKKVFQDALQKLAAAP